MRLCYFSVTCAVIQPGQLFSMRSGSPLVRCAAPPPSGTAQQIYGAVGQQPHLYGVLVPMTKLPVPRPVSDGHTRVSDWKQQTAHHYQQSWPSNANTRSVDQWLNYGKGKGGFFLSDLQAYSFATPTRVVSISSGRVCAEISKKRLTMSQ